jgi:hypothetical protein
MPYVIVSVIDGIVSATGEDVTLPEEKGFFHSLFSSRDILITTLNELERKGYTLVSTHGYSSTDWTKTSTKYERFVMYKGV